ncbi:LPS-assembly protein LptD [Oricola thermophila]|uniref:LPS-assembly protein LptD n=1 Tax=Oricola thermophila TaxID=2742145 RepID=UPI001FECBAF1|nr:LPS-assembly protein LptD [Oricola thermophila]
MALAAALGDGLPAYAAPLDSVAGLTGVESDAPLLLQADELIYDNDRQTVAAVGGVRIDYGGTRMVADRLVYNQRTGRLSAIGNVEIIQPDGTRAYADEFDVTEDFADGFVNALRIVTPDRARFAAESAVREGGETTTFNNGIYTACEPCKDNPEKPPIWQIKARRIIWNGKQKTIRFERASFEFLGMPLAAFPVFTTADPTVKRKTGFLMPSIRFADELGFGASIPYFIALAPNYDLKLTGTGLTRQGFLGEAEFRHRLVNGTYTLKIAGIHQMSPDAFDANTEDATHTDRGMIGSKGRFEINPRWTFGWDVMAQTDKNFSRTYTVEGFDEKVRQNEVYLSGLNDRNSLDLRMMKFNIQETYADGSGSDRDAEQPWVLPSLDYEIYAPRPVAGGELSFNLNARGISRDNEDLRGSPSDDDFATRGLEGKTARITAETQWKRTFVTGSGLTVTPILAAQGDTSFIDASTSATDYSKTGASLTDDDTFSRGMVTAGMEMRWPFLITAPSSTHVVEPIAQVFLRPNEMGAGELPNEDAQSFVFDTTTLFARDKFSGYDRIEGGHRANLGVRYTGTYDNGWSVHAMFGQSYHLGGTNPFADADMVNAGAESGLESDVSDFVGSAGASFANRLDGAVRARFDEKTFEVRRAETELGFRTNRLSASGGFAYIQAQPTYGFDSDRHEVNGRASLRVTDNWKVTGNATYDITNNRLARNGIGLAYDDECFSIGLNFRQSRSSSDALSNSVGFQISLRTIGDFGDKFSGN